MLKDTGIYRIAAEVFFLLVCVVLILSCMSFNIWDAPSRYAWPHSSPPNNWCGPTGAFLSYHLLYFIGPGVFLLLATAVWALLARLFGAPITQPILRAIGLGLVVTATSTMWYLLWPDSLVWPYLSGGFPQGNGGAVGIAVGYFLRQRFTAMGTVVTVSGIWAVGTILLADNVMFAVLRPFGRLLGGLLGKSRGFFHPMITSARKKSRITGDIWKRLSMRQREERFATTNIEHHHAADLEEVIHTPRYERRSRSQGQAQVAEKTQSEPRSQTGSARKADKKRRIQIRASEQKKDTPHIPKAYEDYKLPPLELLVEPQHGFAAVQERMVEGKARTLEDLLAEFGIRAHVVNAEPGPAITMYELELAPGIKVSQISNLANDMARALGAGSVRVVAPLPGRHTIGIEVPNSQREIVRIKELIRLAGAKSDKMQIPLFLGKDSAGEVLISDLAVMPHLLIAGTTGSGKSVCINSIISSILMTRRPDEVKLILIDPKMVEMAIFESLPHLMCPVVTETKRAEQILDWATTKMDERYELLAEAKVRNLASYNKLTWEEICQRFNPSSPDEEAKIPKKMPHIVIIIDELADLMMTAAKEIESYIVRIAQKSRAVGIHLVVATQRPQATVVTGLIKSNMPARVGFRVAARMDSRIILDQNGAETLLGQGDMLFLKPGTSDLVRAQGAFMDDDEIGVIVTHLKEVAEPQFHPELMQLNRQDISNLGSDDLFDKAVRIVLETKRGSVSLLQRRLSVGYARASRIIEMMALAGVLGEYKGSQAREVTMTIDRWEQIKRDMLADEVAGYADLTEEEPEEEQVENADAEDEYEAADEYEYEEIED